MQDRRHVPKMICTFCFRCSMTNENTGFWRKLVHTGTGHCLYSTHFVRRVDQTITRRRCRRVCCDRTNICADCENDSERGLREQTLFFSSAGLSAADRPRRLWSVYVRKCQTIGRQSKFDCPSRPRTARHACVASVAIWPDSSLTAGRQIGERIAIDGMIAINRNCT